MCVCVYVVQYVHGMFVYVSVYLCGPMKVVTSCTFMHVHQTHYKTQQCPFCKSLDGVECDNSQTAFPQIHDNIRLQTIQNLLIRTYMYVCV